MLRSILLALMAALPYSGFAQTSFDVASIRPATERVANERDGRTTISRDALQMHDVSVRNCVAFAYGVSTSQVAGPASISDKRYDIVAKVDHDVTADQMRQMMQALLADRFHLTLHHEQREMRGYVMSVFAQPPKNPAKFHRSAAPGQAYHENSATGTVARNITMKEFADFLSGPLEGPVADQTGLPGQYDLELDFRSYVDVAETDKSQLPSVGAVLNAALKGELGLQITPKKAMFETLVVDRSEDPTPN
ncbi:MAG TPA: TIGR03435 family protein [Acidobacteriaceae bacterium]|nr:TIGR03435 family protein [Acidobacteriaceae bacterium]